MGDPVLAAHGVEKTFHDGTRQLHVLRGVALELAAGEIVAVLGRSGTGKSTLLHMLGLLDRPTAGTIRLLGEAAEALGDRGRTRMRGRALGFVFQQYPLLGEFTALENVTVAGGLGGRGTEAEAKALLECVGLGERLHHRPGTLSGGEQQRVGIARALLGHPAVLLCDEPTGSLDPETGAAVLGVLWNTVRERETSAIVVTHDAAVADRADRVVRLENGRLAAA